MKTHLLECHQHLPAPLDEVWAFFSDPRNLATITPPWLGFRTVYEIPGRMASGHRYRHRIRLFPGIWTHWESEITAVEDGVRFVDEQRAGPYRSWVHEHRFEITQQGVLASDRVEYALPLYPAGELAHLLFVRRQLHCIFGFRRARLIERFGPEPEAEDA